MATIYVPSVAEKDYQSFRYLPNNDFPDSYPEYRALSDERLKQFLVGNTTVVDVVISAAEFARYCHRENCGHYLRNLYAFAGEEALRKNY
jgi:hypothetical protein